MTPETVVSTAPYVGLGLVAVVAAIAIYQEARG